MHDVTVERGQIPVALHQRKKVGPHRNQFAGAAGRPVEPADQLLAPRLRRKMQVAGIVVARLRAPALHARFLRYDLSELRAKGLIAMLPNSRRYQLLPQGHSICLVFLKLFERVYAPLPAGLLSPHQSRRTASNQKAIAT